MTMSKTVAQMRIARELADAEASINEALLKQSQLFSTMIAARQETGVGAALGQDALLRLTRSQQTLLNAGGELARVHGRLLAIGRDLDVVRMEDDCPGRGTQTGFLPDTREYA
jgi:hypothetical protein